MNSNYTAQSENRNNTPTYALNRRNRKKIIYKFLNKHDVSKYTAPGNIQNKEQNVNRRFQRSSRNGSRRQKSEESKNRKNRRRMNRRRKSKFLIFDSKRRSQSLTTVPLTIIQESNRDLNDKQELNNWTSDRKRKRKKHRRKKKNDMKRLRKVTSSISTLPQRARAHQSDSRDGGHGVSKKLSITELNDDFSHLMLFDNVKSHHYGSNSSPGTMLSLNQRAKVRIDANPTTDPSYSLPHAQYFTKVNTGDFQFKKRYGNERQKLSFIIGSNHKDGKVQSDQNREIEMSLPIQARSSVFDSFMPEYPVGSATEVTNRFQSFLKSPTIFDISSKKLSQLSMNKDIQVAIHVLPYSDDPLVQQPDHMMYDHSQKFSSNKIHKQANHKNNIVGMFTTQKAHIRSKQKPDSVELTENQKSLANAESQQMFTSGGELPPFSSAPPVPGAVSTAGGNDTYYYYAYAGDPGNQLT